MTAPKPLVAVTGGAGYIGSLLCGELLRRGYRVRATDLLLFGGESVLPYLPDAAFELVKGDVSEPGAARAAVRGADAVVHLAALVGFPACQQVGPSVARRMNVEATRLVADAAEAEGCRRIALASTYSVYGLAPPGEPVTEDAPLHPQSLYAETKIEAEQVLRERAGGRCAPVIFRFATLFGISPRTRFDLIVNQFVLEAMTRRALVIYQRGYRRSFVHVRDVVEAIVLALEAPDAEVRGETFNVGSDQGNLSKDEVVELVRRAVPGTTISYKDLSFGGDMRDITASFRKIERVLRFSATRSVESGVSEVAAALRDGIIPDPNAPRFRNAQFIVQ
ncbi:MAG: NAD(P)-dependent oxidoreductase [Planctomycetales bacterium]|nr:NAD(P)-dependent oxidoreductase [Planctomycetales bacterium]